MLPYNSFHAPKCLNAGHFYYKLALFYIEYINHFEKAQVLLAYAGYKVQEMLAIKPRFRHKAATNHCAKTQIRIFKN
jgi:hypothetical protein